MKTKVFFQGSKPGSTTVCAYCSKCKHIIISYKQERCANCDAILEWDIQDERKKYND